MTHDVPYPNFDPHNAANALRRILSSLACAGELAEKKEVDGSIEYVDSNNKIVVSTSGTLIRIIRDSNPECVLNWNDFIAGDYERPTLAAIYKATYSRSEEVEISLQKKKTSAWHALRLPGYVAVALIDAILNTSSSKSRAPQNDSRSI